MECATILPAGRLNECCPECGYSLVASPAEGVCPECGQAYDQTAMVLHGGATRAEADLARGEVAGAVTRGLIEVVGFTGFAVYLWTFGRGTTVVWAVVSSLVVLSAAFRLLGNVSRAGEAPGRLYLTPDAFAIVPHRSRSRLLWVSEVLASAAAPAMVAVVGWAVAGALGCSPEASLVNGAAVWLVMLIVVNRRPLAAWWRERRTAATGGPGSVRVAVLRVGTRWEAVKSVEVVRVAEERYRVRFALGLKRWERSEGDGEFVAACGEGQAAAVRAYVTERLGAVRRAATRSPAGGAVACPAGRG